MDCLDSLSGLKKPIRKNYQINNILIIGSGVWGQKVKNSLQLNEVNAGIISAREFLILDPQSIYQRIKDIDLIEFIYSRLNYLDLSINKNIYKDIKKEIKNIIKSTLLI